MKKLIKTIPVLLVLAFISLAFTEIDKKPVKCLIQMTNYEGEGAYLVISLLDPAGDYVETLYVQGQDEEWYSEITQWYDFYSQKESGIDGISGATIAGGERSVNVIQIPADKIDQGYQLRFETSVEDRDYYADDLQFELTSDNLKAKKEGKGFIRYVRMLAQ